MKPNHFFHLSIISTFTLLAILVFGCNKIAVYEGHYDQMIVKTKALENDSNPYLIQEKDLLNYISFKGNKGDEFTGDYKITPISWNGVTCLYAIEYKKGYEILSADKRSPVPLIKDNAGYFEYPTENSPLGFHIYTLAEDVWFSLYKNDLLDEPDKETKDNIESSLLFWKLINADFNTIISRSENNTKTTYDPSILDPEKGHWEQTNVSFQMEIYDTVDHFVPTWWTQNHPYNRYCPYYSKNSTSRCPAGCVAIAGSQVLNYLHHKLGIPDKSPSYGYCSGYVNDSSVVQYFDLFSGYTWEEMRPSSDPKGYAAMLIGDVGQKVKMSYRADSSGAYTEDLKEYVFKPYGIDCDNFSYYSGSFLKGNLERGIPVICAGHREEISSTGEVTYKGHAFIVDSYIRVQEKATFYYEWIFDDPESDPGYPITKTSVAYYTPYIIFYQMNWGYGYSSNYNNVWCNMNGTWQYGTRTPYTHYRKMVCNFSVLTE